MLITKRQSYFRGDLFDVSPSNGKIRLTKMAGMAAYIGPERVAQSRRVKQSPRVSTESQRFTSVTRVYYSMFAVRDCMIMVSTRSYRKRVHANNGAKEGRRALQSGTGCF